MIIKLTDEELMEQFMELKVGDTVFYTADGLHPQYIGIPFEVINISYTEKHTITKDGDAVYVVHADRFVSVRAKGLPDKLREDPNSIKRFDARHIATIDKFEEKKS